MLMLTAEAWRRKAKEAGKRLTLAGTVGPGPLSFTAGIQPVRGLTDDLEGFLLVREQRLLVGLAVSPGIALGCAHCLRKLPTQIPADPLDEDRVQVELASLDRALRSTAIDLEELEKKVRCEAGEEEAAIFRSQAALAHDRILFEKVRRRIRDDRSSAVGALRATHDEYQALFLEVKDDYLRERFADLRDVLQQIENHLDKSGAPLTRPLQGPVVLIARELLPSDVVAISEQQVVAIVTQAGGRTGHAAILARSYGIPAVSGVPGLLASVMSQEQLIVNGTLGQVIVNPGSEPRRTYHKLRREFVHLQKALAKKSAGPATTPDGAHILLMANVNSPVDGSEASRVAADGVGLYRTEFLFLARGHLPSEDDQVQAYREVIHTSPDGPVTIRTLDVGGDKSIPYLAHAPEANPFMGWRSIRLSFEHPELFSAQIRAILRSAHGVSKPIRMLFPMITTWDELQRAHALVAQAKHELSASAVPFGEVEIGMMLEVPAAEVMLDHLLEQVDFVSIGSNDLVQYLTAADRDNPRVSHLCQSLSPAVLRVLQRAIRTCNEAGKSISVCGEMAGSPRAFPLLLGMGLRTFSMSPSFVPVIHSLVAHVTLADAAGLLAEVMKLKTAGEIHSAVDAFLLSICPEVAPLLIA